MKINITIEIDDKELKGLIFGEEEPKTRVNYRKVRDYKGKLKTEQMLEDLKEIADKYGIVSLADYLEITGARKPVYTDNKLGWTSHMLNAASIYDDGHTYRLVLPEPIEFEY